MFGFNNFFGYNNNMKVGVVIIGGGPAGLSAGIFASRAGLDVVCFEKLGIGGQAALSYEILNYPGFENISGYDLTQKMHLQAKKLGVKFKNENVLALKQLKNGFSVKTNVATYHAEKVIIACGCKTRKLNLPNEQTLTGKGVSYCASCDGGFFKNKIVAVVGGGNTAMEDVRYLNKLASKIYLINRSENFKAGEFELNKIKRLKKVNILTNANVVKLYGEKNLTGIDVDVEGKIKHINLSGIFFAIGSVPDLSFVKIKLGLDDYGYIVVDENMKTNVDNLYACGDIISKNFRQIITACGEGAIAGNSCIGEK